MVVFDFFGEWKGFRIKKQQTKHKPFAHSETHTSKKNKRRSEMQKQQRPVNKRIFFIILSIEGPAIRFNLGGFFCFVADVCKNILCFIGDPIKFFTLFLFLSGFLPLVDFVYLFFRPVVFIGFACTRTFLLLLLWWLGAGFLLQCYCSLVLAGFNLCFFLAVKANFL